MISRRSLIVNAVVFVLAIVLLFVAHRIAMSDAQFFIVGEHVRTAEARVIRIVDIERDEFRIDNIEMYDLIITFEAVTGGFFTRDGGEMLTATQSIVAGSVHNRKAVEEGDRVILEILDGQWQLSEYVRMNGIFLLAALFAVLMILFGKSKGFRSLISLGLTCIAIFAVFIPALLSGKNIYLWATLVCIYAIIVTLFIVSGVNKKSIAAVLGCMGGVILAGLLTLLMIWALALTGIVDQESVFLIVLREEQPIDLRAIVFAGIIIGAVGALMDVAMSISSALWEIKSQADDPSFKGLFKSGINIGRDIMGTMANTLVLAYIGGSLSAVLLLMTFASSPAAFLNEELIIVDMLQAIIGSLGILLTMPLTVLLCAFWFSRESGFNDKPLRAWRGKW